MLWTVACAFALALASQAYAQELEPRAYSASPVGANFLSVGYVYSTGTVSFDPSVPITDVSSDMNAAALGYGRTFGLFGKQALVTAALPYAWGNIEGKVFEQARSVYRSGLGDFRAKFSVNLVGCQALTPPEFAKRAPEPLLVGVSLTVVAPTGQYDPEKLINIGTNRWSVKPEFGISYNLKAKLYLDFYAGVWLYSSNNEFFPGSNSREFDPLVTLQAHISYTFAKRCWAAIDATGYTGGSAHLNGGPPSTREEDLRMGTTVSLGLTARQSIKLAYSYGPSPRLGSDFTTVGVAYQVLWF